jgi:hypothetical protein
MNWIGFGNALTCSGRNGDDKIPRFWFTNDLWSSLQEPNQYAYSNRTVQIRKRYDALRPTTHFR